MKKILIVLILLTQAFHIAKAQQGTNTGIKGTLNGGIITYTCGIALNQSGFLKTVERGRSDTYFKLWVYGLPGDNYQTSDAAIIFKDGEVLSFPKSPVSVGKKDDQDAGYFSTYLHLSADDLFKLKTKPIKYYKLIDRKITAFHEDLVMFYAERIVKAKEVYAGADPSTFISKNYDEMKNETIYSSVMAESLQFIKDITPSQTKTWLSFFVYKNDADHKPKMLYVKFSDGTITNYITQADNCTASSNGDYCYTCSLLLNADNIKNFKEKSIVKFQIADVDVPVNDLLSTNVKAWVNAAESLK